MPIKSRFGFPIISQLACACQGYPKIFFSVAFGKIFEASPVSVGQNVAEYSVYAAKASWHEFQCDRLVARQQPFRDACRCCPTITLESRLMSRWSWNKCGHNPSTPHFITHTYRIRAKYFRSLPLSRLADCDVGLNAGSIDHLPRTRHDAAIKGKWELDRSKDKSMLAEHFVFAAPSY